MNPILASDFSGLRAERLFLYAAAVLVLLTLLIAGVIVAVRGGRKPPRD